MFKNYIVIKFYIVGYWKKKLYSIILKGKTIEGNKSY